MPVRPQSKTARKTLAARKPAARTTPAVAPLSGALKELQSPAVARKFGARTIDSAT